MLIKLTNMNFQLGKIHPAIYILIGQEVFQLNTLANLIKKSWCDRHDNSVDLKIIDVNTPVDWEHIDKEAHSYSLFSTSVLVDCRLDKKTLDSSGKLFLERYLKAINSACLLLIRAPLLSVKQLQFLITNQSVQVIQISQPDHRTIKQWINENLNKISPNYDDQIPALIQQHTEGNLLACAQILEKLTLITTPNTPILLEDVKEQLINQCDYSLYDLAESCLTSNTVKVIQLLHQAAGNKTEPTLILWLLTQEIRILMQLLPAQSLREAATKLKIWSNRINIYQSAIKKYDYEFLVSLLQTCNKLDTQIKTNQSKNIWHFLELIALSLCLGKLVGHFV